MFSNLSQFNGGEEGRTSELEGKSNMRKVKGAEEAIDRLSQINHEKAVLGKLQDLGLMLNERNVRKVEAILQQEEDEKRQRLKELEQEKKSRSGSIPHSFLGSQRQSVSQRSKQTHEINRYDDEQHAQKILYEPDSKVNRYSFCDDSQNNNE